MSIYNLFSMIGGLAFFLFGMHIMSNHLEKVAGGRLEGILKKLTSNPFQSLALGAIITIVIQSSSALTVMLVGLVNSGIMEFSATVSIIMGSNIGTTLTAWILSLNGISSNNIFISLLKPENFSPIVALIGVILLMSGKTQKKKDIGTIMCGFAVLMFGMTLMSDSVKPIADIPEFQKLLVAFANPLLSLLIGTALTGVIQSSAATIGILQALALTGQISMGMAVPLVMGANIGTCVTSMLSGIGTSKQARRVPLLHVIFNLMGTVIWMAVYLVTRYVLGLGFYQNAITSFQIAVFHTIFNIGTVILLLPFSKSLGRLIERLLPVEQKETEPAHREILLDERLLLSPGLAVGECRIKTVEMSGIAKRAFLESLELFHHFDPELAARIERMEEELDYMEDQLDTFLIKLSAKDLTEEDNDHISEMLHSINDFERIGDHAMNMTKLAKRMHDSELKFSKAARAELGVLTDALTEILGLTVDSFVGDDSKKSFLVEPLEEVIDDLTKEIKNRHIDRLRSGACSAELGMVLTEYITNAERVSDHCSNVAVSIIQTRNSSFQTHGYLNALKDGRDTSFVENFDAYQSQFMLPEMEEKDKKKKKKDKDKAKEKKDKKK